MVTDLPNALIRPPQGFVGVMNQAVELPLATVKGPLVLSNMWNYCIPTELEWSLIWCDNESLVRIGSRLRGFGLLRAVWTGSRFGDIFCVALFDLPRG
jgi:hypothetical protein